MVITDVGCKYFDSCSVSKERKREREAIFQSQGRLSSHEVNDHWEGLPA